MSANWYRHYESEQLARAIRERNEARAALRELMRAWNATTYPCTERLETALHDAEQCLPEYQQLKEPQS